jgi:hypothetical protein
MSPDMLIGLSLSGLLILLCNQSPAPKSDKPAKKTIATLVLSGSSGEIEIIKDSQSNNSKKS